MYLKPSQILGPRFDSCRSWEMVPGTSCLPAMVCGSSWTMKMFPRSSIATGQHLLIYTICTIYILYMIWWMWRWLWLWLPDGHCDFRNTRLLAARDAKGIDCERGGKGAPRFQLTGSMAAQLTAALPCGRLRLVGTYWFDRLPKQSGRRDRHVVRVMLQHLIPSQKRWKSDSWVPCGKDNSILEHGLRMRLKRVYTHRTAISMGNTVISHQLWYPLSDKPISGRGWLLWWYFSHPGGQLSWCSWCQQNARSSTSRTGLQFEISISTSTNLYIRYIHSYIYI